MKIIKKFYRYTRSLSLRSKLLISYILILIIPITFIAIRYYRIGLNVVTDLASKNVYEIVKKIMK